MDFKVPEDLHTNRNGRVLSNDINNSSIGMPDQIQNMDFSAGDKMFRGGTDPKIFDNNGGYSKAGNAGTINNNGNYGPVTTGF